MHELHVVTGLGVSVVCGVCVNTLHDSSVCVCVCVWYAWMTGGVGCV